MPTIAVIGVAGNSWLSHRDHLLHRYSSIVSTVKVLEIHWCSESRKGADSCPIQQWRRSMAPASRERRLTSRLSGSRRNAATSGDCRGCQGRLRRKRPCRSRHIVIAFLGPHQPVEIARSCSMRRAVEMQTVKFCGAVRTLPSAKE